MCFLPQCHWMLFGLARWPHQLRRLRRHQRPPLPQPLRNGDNWGIQPPRRVNLATNIKWIVNACFNQQTKGKLNNVLSTSIFINHHKLQKLFPLNGLVQELGNWTSDLNCPWGIPSIHGHWSKLGNLIKHFEHPLNWWFIHPIRGTLFSDMGIRMCRDSWYEHAFADIFD